MAKALKLKDITVYEDDQVIAVNKPAHMSSLHERFESSFESVIELCRRENEDYSLCHRLDRETSGIMLIAKNNDAYRHIAIQFEKRTIKKVYHALVSASVDLHDLRVDLPLYTDSKRRVQISKNKGKESLTVFNTLKQFKHHSLLSCEPLSGRLHQIRVHAASQNLPLLSDSLYGGKKVYLSDFKRKTNIGSEPEKPIMDRVALHAYSIEFESPEKGRMELNAPYPKDFEVALKLLAKYDSID